MATQTQDPDLDNLESKPDGSHDDVNLSPAEGAAFDQIAAGYNDGPRYNPGNARSTRKSAGIGSPASSRTHGGGSSSGGPGIQRQPGTRAGNKSLFSRDGDGQAEKPTESALGGDGGPSYSPDKKGSGGLGSRLKSKLNKRNVAIGAGVGGLTGGLLGFYLFTVPILGPFHILSNIWDFNDGPTRDDKGKRRVILMRDFLNGGFREVRLGNRTFRYNEGPLKTKVKDFFKVPTNEGRVGKFMDRARAEGYNFEFDPNLTNANGEFVNRKGGVADGEIVENIQTALVDKDGRVISTLDASNGINPNADESNRLLRTILNDTYKKPLIGLAQRRLVRPVIRQASGIDVFRVFWDKTKTSFENTRARFHAQVHGLDDGQRVNSADPLTGEGTNEDVDNTRAEVSEDVADFAEGLNEQKAPKQIVSEISKRRLASKVGSGAALSLLVLTVGCVAREQYKDDVLQVHQRFAAMLSYFGRALSMAEELVFEAWANIEDVGDLMLDFQRDEKSWVVDSNTDKASIETNTESFADSAAWQRASGAQKITGTEAEPQNTINGNPDSIGEDIFEDFGSILDGVPGAQLSCDIINNSAFQAITLVAELGVCAATAGLGCIVREGAEEVLITVALQKLFAAVAVPDLGVLPVVPDQLLAVIDQGANMSNSLDSRTGKPVSNEAYADEVVSYMENERKELKEKPFLDRMFAFDVEGSLGYKAAMFKTQMSGKAWHNQLSTVFKAPISGLASLFSINRADAFGEAAVCESNNGDESTGCELFDNYGYQKYSYNNDRINQDLIEIEDYTMDLLSASLSSTETQNKYGLEPAEAQRIGLEFGRGCMGLVIDETTISPTEEIQASVDREKSLLPYSNPEAIDSGPITSLGGDFADAFDGKANGQEEAEFLNDLYNSLCIDSANAHPDLYADVGAYVDSLEAMDTMLEAIAPTEGEVDTEFVLDAGDVPELAQQILDHENITFSNPDVESQMQQLADTATASPFGPGVPPQIPVKAKLLQVLLAMADEIEEPLTLNSFIRDPSASGSNHGNGSAIDIHYNSPDERYRFLYDNRMEFTLNELIFQPVPTGTTNLLNGEAHVYSAEVQSDHYDHIHFSVQK